MPRVRRPGQPPTEASEEPERLGVPRGWFAVPGSGADHQAATRVWAWSMQKPLSSRGEQSPFIPHRQVGIPICGSGPPASSDSRRSRGPQSWPCRHRPASRDRKTPLTLVGRVEQRRPLVVAKPEVRLGVARRAQCRAAQRAPSTAVVTRSRPLLGPSETDHQHFGADELPEERRHRTQLPELLKFHPVTHHSSLRLSQHEVSSDVPHGCLRHRS